MTHSSEEVWSLDDGHHGRVSDHIARGFCTDLAGAHVPQAAEAISGYGQMGQFPLPQTYYESYSATETM